MTRYKIEYNTLRVSFDKNSEESVIMDETGKFYITPRTINIVVDGVLRIDDHIYTDAIYTLARTNEYEFWSLSTGYGTLYEAYPDSSDVPEDVLKALKTFEENFS